MNCLWVLGSVPAGGKTAGSIALRSKQSREEVTPAIRTGRIGRSTQPSDPGVAWREVEDRVGTQHGQVFALGCRCRRSPGFPVGA